ncbi:MAG: hypothetical protein GAK30_01607 [Paracidovorax wautersii]|uniref:DUF2242 domain-containing protein n=1 Tax=Paracidovorax wautersii TaxID=1177982 RepID=A0A7V8FPH2_9BURK|nr:MAG: hypothetical protein GAK30_01607 [Paracidovorax wautersii]
MPLLFSGLRPALALGAVLLVAGCASKNVDLAHEAFDDTTTFTRNYAASPEKACEAARRALLSQAYIITNATPQTLAARKHFQQDREQHYEIEFNITCVPDRAGSSTVFANAVQQLYTLRKTNTSASVGVSVLGTLSMPIGSSDDSLVKIGSLTLTKPGLYDRFYGLLEDYLMADAIGQPEPAKAPDTLNPSASEAAQPPTQPVPAPSQSLKGGD